MSNNKKPNQETDSYNGHFFTLIKDGNLWIANCESLGIETNIGYVKADWARKNIMAEIEKRTITTKWYVAVSSDNLGASPLFSTKEKADAWIKKSNPKYGRLLYKVEEWNVTAFELKQLTVGE